MIDYYLFFRGEDRLLLSFGQRVIYTQSNNLNEPKPNNTCTILREVTISRNINEQLSKNPNIEEKYWMRPYLYD